MNFYRLIIVLLILCIKKLLIKLFLYSFL